MYTQSTIRMPIIIRESLLSPIYPFPIRYRVVAHLADDYKGEREAMVSEGKVLDVDGSDVPGLVVIAGCAVCRETDVSSYV